MGASQSSTYQPSITGLSKKYGNLVFKKIDDTEESIPIDTVSIQTVVVDSEGKLIITRTDGSKDGPFNVKGNPGETGPKGSIGATGSQGPQGLKGDPSTVPGPQGLKGDIGSQGPTGPKGSDSTVPGPQGLKGDTGSQGPQGLKGDPSTVPGPVGLKGDIGSQGPIGPKGSDSVVPGPRGNDSDLNYAKFETTMKSKSVWCDNGNCVTPGNSTVNGDISGKSIGRNSTDPDWFRIFGTKSGGTALYNGLSMGDGGLRVGDFNRVPNGQIQSTGDIISGGKIIASGRDILKELAIVNGIPSGPGMHAIYDPTCNNDDVFKDVTGGAVNGICRGNTNFINHQGSGATGGFRFINFKNDKKNIAMETDGEGNLLVKGRDILKELDDLNKNIVRKNIRYNLGNESNGFFKGLNEISGDNDTLKQDQFKWFFRDAK